MALRPTRSGRSRTTLRSKRPGRSRAGEQRLAGSGWPDHEHALRNTRAKLDKLVRFLQKLHNFLQVLLGLFDTGHVAKGDEWAFLVARHFGAAAAKAERLVLPGPHG